MNFLCYIVTDLNKTVYFPNLRVQVNLINHNGNTRLNFAVVITRNVEKEEEAKRS
jgi:hypothetical protein